MLVREIKPEEKDIYNSVVDHPVQSWEWGEFKEKTGVKVVRLGMFDDSKLKSAYQLSFHPIPKTSYTVGYLPKGPLPDKNMLEALIDIGKKNRSIFIKLEPNVKKENLNDDFFALTNDFLLKKGKIVFTPYTFQIDLRKNEEQLLANLKAKTRYNIGLAQRKGVTISEDDSTLAFETYLRLTKETAKRQGFYAHNEEYQRKMWKIMNSAGIAHLLAAKWNKYIITTWILFIFKQVAYYPYGASSNQYRNLMANNLMMWEAIRYGKKVGCHTFDMWGSLGPNPKKKDPWFGFHRFKEGYGGSLIEFMGAYDLIIMPKVYPVYQLADFIRWKWLRTIAHFG